jgi:hypothetical protein
MFGMNGKLIDKIFRRRDKNFMSEEEEKEEQKVM